MNSRCDCGWNVRVSLAVEGLGLYMIRWLYDKMRHEETHMA